MPIPPTPCPFCGHVAPYFYRSQIGAGYIFCQECKAQGPLVHVTHVNDVGGVEVERSAVNAWNRVKRSTDAD